MIKLDPEKRYKTFNEIAVEISKGVLGETNFSLKEKEIYREYADGISGVIICYWNKYEPVNNLSVTLSKLAAVIRNSSLEKYIQNNELLIECLINGSFNSKKEEVIEVLTVIEFYKLLQRLSNYKQKNVLDNIYTRLSTIRIDYDDLPF